MKTRKITSILLATALAACGTPPGPNKPDGGSTIVTPELQVGTGKDAFVALGDGDTIELFHGPQGGTHLWGALRAKGLGDGDFEVQYAITSADGTNQLSTQTYLITPLANGDWREWAGLVGFVPEPSAVIGREVALSIAVKDANGYVLEGSHRVKVVDGAANNGLDGGIGTPGGGCGSGAGLRPGARGEFAAGIDPALGKLAVFGGDVGIPRQCRPAPAFNGETWVFDLTCREWSRSVATGPSPRARVASAMDTVAHRLLVFGGRYRAGGSGDYTLYAETWAYDLVKDAWEQLATTGTGPVGLANATMVFHPVRNAIYLFGGNSSASGLTFTPHNELWQLDLGTKAWTRLSPSGARPAARQFHAMAIDAANDTLYVHSGGDANAFTGPFLPDLWAYDLARNTWTNAEADGAWPDRRIRHQLAFDPTHRRLLVFAGHDDGAQGERNDLSALDLATSRWAPVKVGDKLQGQSNGFCDFPPDFTAPDLGSPERRDGHFLGFDDVRGKFVAFGGKTDCGNVNDLWELDPATDAWTRLEPAFSGESCVRSGKQGCTSLCF